MKNNLESPAKAPRAGLTALKHLKRVVVSVMGGTVLAIGLMLVILPGPALLVIPAGLAILAIEFTWAKHWLKKARSWLRGERVPAPPSFLSLASLNSAPTRKP